MSAPATPRHSSPADGRVRGIGTDRVPASLRRKGNRNGNDARLADGHVGGGARTGRGPRAGARAGRGDRPGHRLRNLPHRPARGSTRRSRAASAGCDTRPSSVGRVTRSAPGSRTSIGDLVGVAWLRRTCGTCGWCRSRRGESVSSLGVHRLGRRRRIRRARRPRLRSSIICGDADPSPPRRCCAQASSDSEPSAARTSRRRPARPLRLRLQRSPRRPDRDRCRRQRRREDAGRAEPCARPGTRADFVGEERDPAAAAARLRHRLRPGRGPRSGRARRRLAAVARLCWPGSRCRTSPRCRTTRPSSGSATCAL